MSSPPLRAIGEHVDPVSSWTPERDDPDGVFTYVDLSAVDQNAKVVSGARELACSDAPSRARQLIRAGDVLVSTVRPNLNGVALVPPELDGATASTGFCVLRPRASQLDARYLYQWVKSPRFVTDMVRKATGASYPAVSDRIVYESKLPLLPLPEQRRIAEIMDKADALRAKRRAALAQLDTFTQSIFLDMFGDAATNPKGWPVVSIADICEVKGGKRLPKGEEYSSIPTPFRYIRVVDLKAGRVDESALVYLKPATQAEIARYVVNADDVIISIAGSIGLVAPVPRSLDGVNLTENAAKIVPRSSRCYEAEYLARYLETDHAQRQIGSHIGQVTIGKLALFRIEKLRVPLPPIEVQREFVCRASEVEAHRTVQREACSRLDELFASLQHRAFRGEL
jgi:type I restriction enzyme S subunit